MGSREEIAALVTEAACFYERLANTIPYPAYFNVDGGLTATATDNASTRREAQSKKASLRRYLRYDSTCWRSCAAVLAVTTRRSRAGRKRQRPEQQNGGDEQQPMKQQKRSSGRPSGESNVSRDELRRKLHAKIAALHAEQQKKQEQHRRQPRVADLAFNGTVGDGFASSSPPQKPQKKKQRVLRDALETLTRTQKERAELLPEKRKDIEHRGALDKALTRAGGGKVYDNEKKLKKALKQRERKVAKSQTRWAGRQQAMQEDMKARQHKRQQNIDERRSKKKR